MRRGRAALLCLAVVFGVELACGPSRTQTQHRCGPRTRVVSFTVGGTFESPDPFYVHIGLEEESDPPNPRRILRWAVRGSIPFEAVQGVEMLDADTHTLLMRIPLPADPGTRSSTRAVPGKGFDIRRAYECRHPMPCYEGPVREGMGSFLELFDSWSDRKVLIVVHTSDPEVRTIVFETRKRATGWERGRC